MSSRILTFIFAFILLGTVVLFGVFYNFQKNKYFSSLENRYISVAQIIIFSKMKHQADNLMIDKAIKHFDIKLISNNKSIFTKENILKEMSYPKISITVYEFEKKLYVNIQHMGMDIYLIDNSFERFCTIHYLLFFLSAMGVLILVYFTFIKKDIENKKARDMLIANIMHELKTPITKGKLTLTLLNDEKNSQRLNKVFNRMETLVNEFAFIEELANNHKIEKNRYKLNDIVDNAVDLLLDDCKVIKNYKNILMEVNYNLLSICIKNLIDNGIKYSSNNQVELLNNEHSYIIVKSHGEKLSKPLSYYTQAFHKGKHTNGFGLGLYIVQYILNSHNMKLKYSHKGGYNFFAIV